MPNQVSFTSPSYDYGVDLAAVERRRRMAEMLQQEGMQQIPEQPVGQGQFATRISPFQMAAKLAQSYVGARGAAQADAKQKELALAAQTERQKALASLLRGDQAPRDPNAPPQPSYGQPGFQPSTSAPSGDNNMLANIPPQIAALITSGDPEFAKLGTTLLDANKGIAQRPGAPVVNPFTGKVIAQPTPSVPQGVQIQLGPNGPQASQVPGYSQAMTGINSIPNPSQGMIPVKTSSGQDIQLTQPEYLDWQKSGQLPSRYGGRPAPASSPAQAQGIPNALIPPPAPTGGGYTIPGAPGLGIIGAGQSQQDVINQERQRAGGKALDEAFAKDYANFAQGGAADSAKQLAQLQDVTKALKTPGANITGPLQGNLPIAVRNVTNPQSVAMQERVEEVVQRSLRAILGAQFTENEGQRLIARAYNPRLSESENAIRVGRLYTQLNQAFQQKKDAARYFERHGTLDGWRGKLPSISDFDPDAGRSIGGGIPDPLGIRK